MADDLRFWGWLGVAFMLSNTIAMTASGHY
jgi:hypothetical protein